MSITILFIVVEYIVITYIFGLLLGLIGGKCSSYIQRCFGWNGYCVLGTVGVTYHELSHLIIAIIFRHKINEVRLFRPIKGKKDGTLGYVNHSWNKRNMYQEVGCFFIGTAPMLFGTGSLFLLMRFAYPTIFVIINEVHEIPSALGFTFASMFVSTNLLSWWTLIVLLVALFICPYMHMSWPDVKGATSGAVALIIASVLLSLVSMIIPSDVSGLVQRTMNTVVNYYFYALIIGLAVNILLTAFFGIVSLIKNLLAE